MLYSFRFLYIYIYRYVYVYVYIYIHIYRYSIYILCIRGQVTPDSVSYKSTLRVCEKSSRWQFALALSEATNLGWE